MTSWNYEVARPDYEMALRRGAVKVCRSEVNKWGRRKDLRPLGSPVPSKLGCFLFALPHEMGEQRTPHAAATQQAASDEEPEHPALSTSVFAFVLVLLLSDDRRVQKDIRLEYH